MDRTFFSCIIAILLVTSFLLLRPIQQNKEIDVKRYWINKVHQNEKYNVVFVGDSRIYRGLSPDHFSSKFKNIKAYNFGFSSGSFSDRILDEVYLMLNKKAERIIVILGITPHSLTNRAYSDYQYNQEVKRKKEEILEYKYLYPIKTLFYPLDINKTDEWFNNTKTVFIEQYQYNSGWVAVQPNHYDSLHAIKSYTTIFNNNLVKQQHINQLLERVKQWTTEEGIKIYAFRPPTTNTMVNLEDSLSGFNEQLFIKSFENAGGKWLQFRNNDFRSYDGSHLDKKSAIRLSEEIATRIKSIETNH